MAVVPNPGKKMINLAVITGDPSLPDSTKPDNRYHEEDIAAHLTMRAAFESLDGFETHLFERHETLFADLVEMQPDLVVNFCDTGFRNVIQHELHVAAQLELLGFNYTGAKPQAMVICFDKQIVRLVAKELGLPVAQELFLAGNELAGFDADSIAFPALIKPNAADGSVGITQKAQVNNVAEARDYLQWLGVELPGRDILIQEYLPGPEFSVGMIGNDDDLMILPPLEMDFSQLPEGLPPILSYESKSLPDSPYWTDIGFRQANYSQQRLDEITDWGRKLFRRFDLRDYARLDFRFGIDGEPKLMEVNPNPAWANDGKLAIMSGLAGIEYPQMLERIVEAALRREADSPTKR